MWREVLSSTLSYTYAHFIYMWACSYFVTEIPSKVREVDLSHKL